MALGYIIVALIIILINFSEIPAVFALIFKSAFGAEATFGGIVGSAISWVSNEESTQMKQVKEQVPMQQVLPKFLTLPSKVLCKHFSVYIDTWFVLYSYCIYDSIY